MLSPCGRDVAEIDRVSANADWPTLIQGGMGVAVSGWRLASAVSRSGQLGVVSGTALAVVMARTLQDGDPGGHLRDALASFPDHDVAGRILERYHVPGGRPRDTAYRAVPVPRWPLGGPLLELTIAASFAEVHLAKRGHDGPVGINLLQKVQLPTLATLYGAMLAGVDYVLMGAGVPLGVPAALDALASGAPAELALSVEGAPPDTPYVMRLDPAGVLGGARPLPLPLHRPRFLAIVGSHVLAGFLARDPDDRPDGFVIERPSAGGHNAPPRGRMTLSDTGEPVYGPRDDVDVEQVRALGLPFWLAGGYGHPEGLRAARAAGACGVQVGTAFALCAESGLEPDLKRRALELANSGDLVIRTDAVASPTGFPFKIAQIAGSASDSSVQAQRKRRCDLAYLATPYHRSDGGIGYRCPGEPAVDYAAKGADAADTIGRLCLCNGLTAAVGRGQRRADGTDEPPLLTLGDDAVRAAAALSPDGRGYAAADVVRHVLAGTVHETA